MLKRIYWLGFFLLFLLNFNLCQAADLSFRVDKSKVRLIVPPGTSQAGVLKVYSQSSDPIKIKVHFEDWNYAYEQNGSKEFFPPNSMPYSCSDWVSVNPQEFTLPPLGSQSVNFVVKTPAEAKGAYFSVMFFETAFLPGLEGISSNEGELRVGTTLNVKMGVLFYIESQDTVQRQVEIKNLSLTQNQGSGFFVNLDLKNTGNADITSKATFDLIDEKGLVYARGELNDTYTFPGQQAKLTGIWKKSLDSGVYDLILTFDLGKSLEEVGMGRGPVIVKEARVEIGPGGEITSVSELR